MFKAAASARRYGALGHSIVLKGVTNPAISREWTRKDEQFPDMGLDDN